MFIDWATTSLVRHKLFYTSIEYQVLLSSSFPFTGARVEWGFPTVSMGGGQSTTVVHTVVYWRNSVV